MTLANDSILVTPGSGATVATHTAGGKEHQAIVIADASGQLIGSKPTFTVASQNSANVAAARTTHFDLFNASGSGVILRVQSVLIIPTLAAVTGVGLTWEIIRTNTVGTGGTVRTPVTLDTANAALPGTVTARSKPTAGAATLATLFYPNGSSEETTPYAGLASILNNIPELREEAQPIVLREGQGLKVDQTTNSAVGSSNIVITFTVE